MDGCSWADVGAVVPLDALFTGARSRMARPPAAQLGCAFEDGPATPRDAATERSPGRAGAAQ